MEPKQPLLWRVLTVIGFLAGWIVDVPEVVAQLLRPEFRPLALPLDDIVGLTG